MFGIDDIANAVSGWMNYANQSQANQQNYEMEQQNLAWQKQAQQTTWNREDNAVQRRVADLRAAGLSPTLAAGSAASTSSPISTVAPQRQVANMPDHLTYGLDAIGNTAQLVMGALKQKADISQTEAQTRLLNLQALGTAQNTALTSQKVIQGNYNQQYDINRGVKIGTPQSAAATIAGDIVNGTMEGIRQGGNLVSDATSWLVNGVKSLWNKGGK